jgi:hypothetical protein
MLLIELPGCAAVTFSEALEKRRGRESYRVRRIHRGIVARRATG